MRTTVELPPYLMRAAKAKSAERGESLKAFLTRAVEAEVGGHAKAGPLRKRVTFPMFGDPNGPKVNITNEMLEQATIDDEVENFHRINAEVTAAREKRSRK